MRNTIRWLSMSLTLSCSSSLRRRPAAIQRHQHRAVKEILGARDQPLHFVRAEDDRQPARTLGIRQVLLHVPPLEHAQIEEAERRQLGDDRAHGQASLLEQVDLVAPEIVGTDAVEPLPDVSVEGVEDLEIALAGRRRVVAAHELVVQTLQQWRHRQYLL